MGVAYRSPLLYESERGLLWELWRELSRIGSGTKRSTPRKGRKFVIWPESIDSESSRKIGKVNGGV